MREGERREGGSETEIKRCERGEIKRLLFLDVKRRCTDPELRPVASKTELLHFERCRVLLLKHRKLDLLQTETGDEAIST